MNERYQIVLYNRTTWLEEVVLENATSLRVEEEANGVHTLRFNLPSDDPKWTFLEFNKICRLVDTSLDTPTATIQTANSSVKQIAVNDATPFTTGDFVNVFVTQNAGDTFIYRSFVAKITNVSSNVLTLSRFDYNPNTSGFDYIQKVNFTTFRVSPQKWKRSGSIPTTEITCNHCGYALDDRFFLVDGRGEITYGINSSGSLVDEKIDADSLLTQILADEPAGWGYFIKGDVTAALANDRREIRFDRKMHKRVAIRDVAQRWTDETYFTHFTVNEDLSVDLTRVEVGTSADPTSGLTIDVDKNENAIERDFQTERFGNIVIPEGSRSDWINCTTGISTEVVANAANTRDSFRVNIPHYFRHGDPVMMMYTPVDSVVTGGTKTTLQDTTLSLNAGEYVRGKLYIYQNTNDAITGVGQIRSISDNTSDTFIVDREFDTIPNSDMKYYAVKGKDIAYATVRGFSVREGVVTSAGGSTITATALSEPVDIYQGGIVNIQSGNAEPQTKTLKSNTGDTFVLDFGENFTPIPEVGSKFVVIAPPIRAEQHGVLESETITTTSTSVTFSPSPAWKTNIFQTATMVVVKGTGKGQSRSVSGNTASTLNTELAWVTEPDDTSEILVWIFNTNVELSLTYSTDNPNTPAANDVVVLLCNRPNGSPLTIGEHFDYRDYVIAAEVDRVEINNDVSKFAVNQTIFIGAKTYTREQGFMMRGNQWLGVHRRITAINSNILTVEPELTQIPVFYDHVKILSLVDSASITANGAKEMEFSDSRETNPLRLATLAQTFMNQRKNIVSKYTINLADLYELDRLTWAREKFSIGDTIWVIDDDYGIDNKSVLVTSRSWNPNDPREVRIRADNYTGVEFLEYADEIADMGLELAKTESQVTWTNFIAKTPICLHFDINSKSCTRNTPPNFFCNSGHSARNGRTTKEGNPLTTAHCSAFVSAALQGATGPQGNQGAQGATGAGGPQGAQGATGSQGSQGPQGATGPQGNQGAQGAQGATGPGGNQGAQGAQGTQGSQGATGPGGNQGATGAGGSQGSLGATGPGGNQGTQGGQGSQGATGPGGSQGSQGAQGSLGATGPQGSQGAQGSKEAKEPQGRRAIKVPRVPEGLRVAKVRPGLKAEVMEAGKVSLPLQPVSIGGNQRNLKFL